MNYPDLPPDSTVKFVIGLVDKADGVLTLLPWPIAVSVIGLNIAAVAAFILLRPPGRFGIKSDALTLVGAYVASHAPTLILFLEMLASPTGDMGFVMFFGFMVLIWGWYFFPLTLVLGSLIRNAYLRPSGLSGGSIA